MPAGFSARLRCRATGASKLSQTHSSPWPNPIAEANDQNRIPAGTRLSAAEKEDLKDGTLFELVQSVSINRLTKAETKTYIEGLWVARQTEALDEYQEVYRDVNLVGKAFDGASWN